jgi:hypothetical protein
MAGMPFWTHEVRGEAPSAMDGASQSLSLRKIHHSVHRSLRNVRLRTPPGPEGSNGSD